MTAAPSAAPSGPDRPSVFGPTSIEPALPSTGFGALGAEASLDKARASAFDLCHAGVVLRAVLFVQGVLALGVAVAGGDAGRWWMQFAPVSAAALPALALWLLVICLGQRLLARGSLPVQWLAVTVWGGVCGAGAWWLWRWVPWTVAPDYGSAHVLATAATGAAMAAAFFHWLRQRVRLQSPAEAAARLAELQSRIRPHFLFNTLNTAVALVRIDPSRAEAVLEDLAELFRVALADVDRHTASSVRDEIELARRYLAIEQLRFGERLQLRWELDPQADDARLPPLLLQPLVENAVKHGIEPAPRGGIVRVRTRVRRGQVELTVVNTLSDQASTPGQGMALHNVYERLKLMHDVAADFSARRDGDSYRVRIVVPL